MTITRLGLLFGAMIAFCLVQSGFGQSVSALFSILLCVLTSSYRHFKLSFEFNTFMLNV